MFFLFPFFSTTDLVRNHLSVSTLTKSLLRWSLFLFIFSLVSIASSQPSSRKRNQPKDDLTQLKFKENKLKVIYGLKYLMLGGYDEAPLYVYGLKVHSLIEPIHLKSYTIDIVSSQVSSNPIVNQTLLLIKNIKTKQSRLELSLVGMDLKSTGKILEMNRERDTITFHLGVKDEREYTAVFYNGRVKILNRVNKGAPNNAVYVRDMRYIKSKLITNESCKRCSSIKTRIRGNVFHLVNLAAEKGDRYGRSISKVCLVKNNIPTNVCFDSMDMYKIDKVAMLKSHDMYVVSIAGLGRASHYTKSPLVSGNDLCYITSSGRSYEADEQDRFWNVKKIDVEKDYIELSGQNDYDLDSIPILNRGEFMIFKHKFKPNKPYTRHECNFTISFFEYCLSTHRQIRSRRSSIRTFNDLPPSGMYLDTQFVRRTDLRRAQDLCLRYAKKGGRMTSRRKREIRKKICHLKR